MWGFEDGDENEEIMEGGKCRVRNSNEHDVMIYFGNQLNDMIAFR